MPNGSHEGHSSTDPLKAFKNCWSMFKYEMQAPSSGHHGEMKIKGLVATPGDSSQSQTSGDPWSLSRDMWERHAPAVSGDKELCVSFGLHVSTFPKARIK